MSITDGGERCKQCFGRGVIAMERGHDELCPRCQGDCCEPADGRPKMPQTGEHMTTADLVRAKCEALLPISALDKELEYNGAAFVVDLGAAGRYVLRAEQITRYDRSLTAMGFPPDTVGGHCSTTGKINQAAAELIRRTFEEIHAANQAKLAELEAALAARA